MTDAEWAALVEQSGGTSVYDQAPSTSVSDVANPSVDVPWYAGLSSIITSVGKAATGVLQAQQGVVYDQYGRLISAQGRAVTNYAPTGTLGGVVSGMSVTTLLLLGLGVYLVLKLAK